MSGRGVLPGQLLGRFSVRLRLTLLIAAGALACGVVMVAALYLLMRYVPTYDLAGTPGVPVIEDPVGGAPVAPPGPGPAGPSGGGTDPAGTVVPGIEVPPGLPEIAVDPALLRSPDGAVRSTADVLHALVRYSGVAVPALVLLGALLGWVVAGRVLAPVHRITATARDIADGNPHERIRMGPRDGRDDEFTRLSASVDAMLDRLQAGLDAQRQFTANASHELRTPLAATRTARQVALAHPGAHDPTDLLRKLLAANEHSIATVEALLTLARAEHALEPVEPVDLADTAAQALAEVAPEAAGRSVTMHRDLGSAVVLADADLLRLLVVNLLHNAIRHNHRGGSVALTVRGRDGAAELVVENTGDVPAVDEVERLFERFRRNGTRSAPRGHGLGLSIVRAIADGHGGAARAVPRERGGLAVTVTLPAAGHGDLDRPVPG
ncbi:HAMP domain-containing sensor histidine kinase [Pseudonocardia sp. ICBG1293]|uniref:sensor histidine kinase n=1 Tax=Pseudonocardia sp. ICBG1293 TaxID=2844382 RepID=UPI001CCCA07E|nr:HAMP domain-containing sensor histidine kinase [Pseudonocardia sp. ICBG1293]